MRLAPRPETGSTTFAMEAATQATDKRLQTPQPPLLSAQASWQQRAVSDRCERDMQTGELIKRIESAFREEKYPGDDGLTHGSSMEAVEVGDFLVAAVRDYDDSDQIPSSLLSLLSPFALNDSDYQTRFRQRYELFNDSQRDAIRAFLEYLRDTHSEDFPGGDGKDQASQLLEWWSQREP